jgi:hypothetical protein
METIQEIMTSKYSKFPNFLPQHSIISLENACKLTTNKMAGILLLLLSVHEIDNSQL